MRLGRSLLIGAMAIGSVPAISLAAAFGDNSIVVVRSGDANFASAGGGAVPAYLDEYAPDGTLMQSIPLGDYNDLVNPQFSLIGGGGNSGLISKSYDGQYLVLGGYAATLGAVAPVSDPAVQRTVARVGLDGSVDTTTRFSGTSTYEARSVVSADGNQFWVSTNSGSNRVRYVGSLGANTSVRASNFSQNLSLGIFTDLEGDAQLYGTRNSNSNALYRLNRAGEPNPKLPQGATGDATVTNLISTASDTSAWDFVIFNDNNTTLTLYVADEDSTSGSGVQKWTSTDGTAWTFQYALNETSMRGLTAGLAYNGAPVLFATASNGSGVYRLVDWGPGSTWELFASAPENTYFHDVALPNAVPEPATLALLGLGGLVFLPRRRCSF